MDIDIILQAIKKRRENSKATKKDVLRILEAMETDNWGEVHQSKLYKKHSGEYCELLSIIHFYSNNPSAS